MLVPHPSNTDGGTTIASPKLTVNIEQGHIEQEHIVVPITALQHPLGAWRVGRTSALFPHSKSADSV